MKQSRVAAVANYALDIAVMLLGILGMIAILVFTIVRDLRGLGHV